MVQRQSRLPTKTLARVRRRGRPPLSRKRWILREEANGELL
jgi:hypothetical protein